MDKANIDSVTRLSGLQEAFLIHHLQVGYKDKGIIQMHADISGNLTGDLFLKAWKKALSELPALRTSFHWKDLKRPVQIVQKEVSLNSKSLDWSDETTEVINDNWEALLGRDRKTIQLDQSPVSIISYIKLSDDRYRFLWTCHHILLDGWSSALILGHIFDYCRANLTGTAYSFPASTPFKDYVFWEQDLPKIRQARRWRTLLKESYPQESVFRNHANSDEYTNYDFHCSSFKSDELSDLSRKNQISSSALIFAAWGLILSRLSKSENCVFGLTVSGRNNEFKDSESMIGMFANTVPFPVQVSAQNTLPQLAKAIFKTQEEIQTLETSPAADIHKWCELPSKQVLFDSLLVIGNYPQTQANENDPFIVEPISGQLSSPTPITLSFEITDRLQISVIADKSIPTDWVEVLASCFETILRNAISSEHITCDELGNIVPEPPQHSNEQSEHDDKDAKEAKTVVRIEQELIRDIWADILETTEIGPDDSFFDLGGNSLLSARLIEKLQTVFQRPVPFNILFDAPTVHSMSEYFISTDVDKWPILIPLQKGGDGPPLFLFHEMGVSIFHYKNLIKHLPEDLTIYGVQAPFEPEEQIRPLTELYLKEIRKLYPDGAYYLGGYCFGGIVAYDMAVVLEKQGTPPKGLFVIELSFAELIRFRPRYLWAIFREENLWQHTVRMTNKVLKILNRLTRAVIPGEKGFKDEAKDYYDTSLLPETTRHRTEVHFRAARDYKPEKYQGEIVVIACDTVYSRRDPDVGWDRLIDDPKKRHIYHNVSDHHSILEEPYVIEVADAIVKHLDQ